MMKTYTKIDTIFRRDPETKKLIPGDYITGEVGNLRNVYWFFTEKVDGTNARVHWDGYRVTYGGRTDNANLTPEMIAALDKYFGGEENETLFEQKFGETPVTLYGELYGPKIQKGGGLYGDEVDFILFDVMIADNFQPRDSLVDVAQYFHIRPIPVAIVGKLDDGIKYVLKNPKSQVAKYDKVIEGVVGQPIDMLKDRCGRRIIVKIKVKDFEPIREYYEERG